MARRALTASTAATDARFASAFSAMTLACSKREFIEDEEGRRVRQFRSGETTKDADVQAWLNGSRAVELEDGLEYVSQSVIDRMVKRGDLRALGGGLFAITEQCVQFYSLRRIKGVKYPK